MKLLEYNPGRQPKIDWEQVHQEMENDRIYREFVYQKMQKERHGYRNLVANTFNCQTTQVVHSGMRIF